jgi:hypothetical protein
MKAQFIFFLFCIFLFLPSQGQAQLISVSGFVKNQSTGKAKGNATVFESVSGIGTITNSEGYYRLLLNPGQQKLEISSAGFDKYSSTFKLVNDTIISVELVSLNLSQEKTDAAKVLNHEPYTASGTGKDIGNKTK